LATRVAQQISGEDYADAFSAGGRLSHREAVVLVRGR
jgi:hypothetical protein